MSNPPAPAASVPPASFLATLGVAAIVGVVIAVGFEAFETASGHVRDLLWVDLLGDDPQWWATVAFATAGGLALGAVLLVAPGGGGPHPAESHAVDGHVPSSVSAVIGTLVVGFVTLVAGASLGPEGALIPAALGVAVLAARWTKLAPEAGPAMSGSALAALLAAMFGSPLAGAVPLLEVAPVSGASLTLLILPALTASATAVLTLRLMDAQAAGFLQLGFEGFQRGDLVWAAVIGIAAGAAIVVFQWCVTRLRALVIRLERIHLVVATTIGGCALGVLYVIGGTEVRFSGVPELQFLVASTERAGPAMLAVAAKLIATAVCLAVGYRGGKIFPLTFVGGALGLAAHLAWNEIPLPVAVTAGLAGAIAVGVEAPVVAALIAAALVGPSLLPLAVVAVVSAYSLFLVNRQFATLAAGSVASRSDPDSDASS